MQFNELGLSERSFQAVEASGYGHRPDRHRQDRRLHPSDDLQARTGRARPHAAPLILEPTRELAAQVEESFDKYGKSTTS